MLPCRGGVVPLLSFTLHAPLLQLLLGCSEFTAFAAMMAKAAARTAKARESLAAVCTWRGCSRAVSVRG